MKRNDPLKLAWNLISNVMLKNPEPVFTANGKAITDPRLKARAATGVIQAFLSVVPSADGKRMVQAFTGTDTIGSLTDASAWNIVVQERPVDTQYQNAFKTIELRDLGGGRKDTSWKIATGKRGVEMKEIPEGGKVSLAGFNTSVQTVNVTKYGMGFGLTWEMLNSNDFNAFKDALMNTRSELYATWEDVHYALLQAAADDSEALDAVTWQSASASTVTRDIDTINKMASDLIKANYSKGYGALTNGVFPLFYDEVMDARIQQALRQTTPTSSNTSTVTRKIVPYPIKNDAIYRSAADAADKPFEPIMCIPGNKMQNALHTQELGLSENDILSLSEIHTAWTAFGAAIGDVEQTIRGYFHA